MKSNEEKIREQNDFMIEYQMCALRWGKYLSICVSVHLSFVGSLILAFFHSHSFFYFNIIDMTNREKDNNVDEVERIERWKKKSVQCWYLCVIVVVFAYCNRFENSISLSSIPSHLVMGIIFCVCAFCWMLMPFITYQLLIDVNYIIDSAMWQYLTHFFRSFSTIPSVFSKKYRLPDSAQRFGSIDLLCIMEFGAGQKAMCCRMLYFVYMFMLARGGQSEWTSVAILHFRKFYIFYKMEFPRAHLHYRWTNSSSLSQIAYIYLFSTFHFFPSALDSSSRCVQYIKTVLRIFSPKNVRNRKSNHWNGLQFVIPI